MLRCELLLYRAPYYWWGNGIDARLNPKFCLDRRKATVDALLRVRGNKRSSGTCISLPSRAQRAWRIYTHMHMYAHACAQDAHTCTCTRYFPRTVVTVWLWRGEGRASRLMSRSKTVAKASSCVGAEPLLLVGFLAGSAASPAEVLLLQPPRREGARQGVRAGRRTGIGRFDGRVDLVRSCSACLLLSCSTTCGIQRGYEHCNQAREFLDTPGKRRKR